MPHYLVERISQLDCCVRFSARKDCATSAYAIEVLDIFGGILFLCGSFCFKPKYARDVQVFILGCDLYIVGSLIFMLVCSWSFVEALHSERYTHALWENALYVVGSGLFAVGCVLYMPERDHCQYEEGTCESIAHTVNLYGRELLGTALFILGSMVFAFAAFANALGQEDSSSWPSRLLRITTSCYLGGSIFFAMGSVAFLPAMGCSLEMVAVGAGCFIWGSAVFIVGSLVSLRRTIMMLNSKGEEDSPLVSDET